MVDLLHGEGCLVGGGQEVAYLLHQEGVFGWVVGGLEEGGL